jgi:uncharacterized repeat protein (TIGR03803 family)
MDGNHTVVPRVSTPVAGWARFSRAVVFALATTLLFAGTVPSARAVTSGVLYSFKGGNDGSWPRASLIEVGGVFYGTTVYGGGTGCGGTGCGTVFSLTPGGVEKVIYSFQGGKDGMYPQAGLIKVGDKLYGTTSNALNTPDCFSGQNLHMCGTVFSITPSGVHKVLHVFKGAKDGAKPMGNLLEVNGILYGTTEYGGSTVKARRGTVNYGAGTVFSITRAGIWKTVYAFPGGDMGDDFPTDGLINVDNTLYGVGNDAVFAVTLDGAESVVHGFKGGRDGVFPQGALVNVNGLLYGTTNLEGRLLPDGSPAPNGCCGTVFKLNPTTKAESPIYAFNNGADNGGNPVARLTYAGGLLYGATYFGTVFSVTRLGVEKVLTTFTSGASNGPTDLAAGLTEVNGTLYGTGLVGGQGTGCGNGDRGCGIVYWVKP